jgi:hypothetical protein
MVTGAGVARPASPPATRRRFALIVLSRLLAAAGGGYAFTYTATASLAVLLPATRSEAVLIASMLSFVIYTGAILFAFGAQDLRRVWLGLLLPAIVCAAIGFSPGRG